MGEKVAARACSCLCHSMPGLKHVAPCCSPRPAVTTDHTPDMTDDLEGDGFGLDADVTADHTPEGLSEEVGRLRLVRQEHEWGCGVAALAMVTGQTYDEVRTWIMDHWVYAVMGREQSADWLAKHGVTQYVLDWYLGEHGYTWRRRYKAWEAADAWPPEPFAPVHVAQVIQPSGMAHFVVLTPDGRVLDPMSDTPRSLSEWEQVNFVQGFWPLAALRAECDVLREQTARVEALGDGWERDVDSDVPMRDHADRERIRGHIADLRALAALHPDPNPQEPRL